MTLSSLHLVAAAITVMLAFAAWRSGRRGAPKSTAMAWRTCSVVWAMTTFALWPLGSA